MTLLLFNGLLLCGIRVNAQISVSATAGVSGPTSYSNLRLAFAAVNDGTHQGAITIDITSSPSADNNTAVLNASGSGSASYTSILVQPEGSTGSRSITGTVNGGPLVDLNGADNVTVNGRPGDGYSLTISNQSNSSSAGTSTIRFVNDATNNVIMDIAVLGRSTGAAGSLAGSIIFGSGSSTGNDGNTISRCTIANDGTSTTDLISQAIVSTGSTGSLASHNSGNLVEDCLVHDFFLAGGSRGILLGAGNHQWSIIGNRFFQSAARTTATANSEHHIIHVGPGSHADAGGHLIGSNILGHGAANGTGMWELSGSSNRFRAILVELANSGERSQLRSNSIAGIAHATSASGTGATAPSSMIHILSGTLDVVDNTIGSPSDTSSIVYTPPGPGRHFHAIFNADGSELRSSRNTIGGITLNGPGGLYAILSNAAHPWQCDSNVVGGTVAHSMRIGGTSAASLVSGIAGVGTHLSARNNVIRNLSCASGDAQGLSVSGGSLAAEENSITTLQAMNIVGLETNNTPATIEQDQLSSFHGTTSTPSNRTVHGIRVTGDTVTITGCIVEDLKNFATGSSANTRGISATNAVVDVQGTTIAELTGESGGLTVCGVVGIYTSAGSLHAEGNTIEDLSIPSGHAIGIHIADAPLTALQNSIAHVEARSVRGILAERAPAVVSGNTIATLTGTLTNSSNTTVTAIAVLDSALVASNNTLEALSNGAVGPQASVRGIHAIACEVSAQANTISGLDGNGTGNTVAGVVGILVEQGNLEALGNNLSGLHNTSTRTTGLQVQDGAMVASSNIIVGLSARNVDGVCAERSPSTLSNNRIGNIRGIQTGSSNTSVNGIVAIDSLMVVANNEIRDLANESNGPSSTLRGIVGQEAPLVASGNSISRLRGNGIGATVPGVAGIAVEHSSNHTHAHVEKNVIHTLHSAHETLSSQVIGIYALLRDTTNVVEGNLIHSLWRNTTAVGTRPLAGVHLAGGSSTLSNNMISLGLDSTGAAAGAPVALTGIRVTAGTHAILHNTVYIGGEATTASSNHTYALYSEVTGTRDHRNNILWNARSNGAGSAKHYAVGVNASLTGLVSDYNCLYVSGTGGHVGREGNTDRSTLGAWQSATSLDGNSISVDPDLVNVTGPVDSVDLRIEYGGDGGLLLARSGAEGTGVLTDIDGTARTLQPDIGAHQIEWGAIEGDVCMGPIVDPFIDEPVGNNATIQSQHGYRLPAHGTIRVLVVLVELVNALGDPLPYNEQDAWPEDELPIWVDNVDPTKNLFDHEVPQSGITQGQVTRYYQQASSGNLIILGDYLKHPYRLDHTFQVRAPKTGWQSSWSSISNHISSILTPTSNPCIGTQYRWSTYYGNTDCPYGEFDLWTSPGIGREKNYAFDDQWDHIAVFIKNGDNRVGRSSGGNFLGRLTNTATLNGSPGGIPTDVFRHEFAHMLYGSNNFHSGGGGWGVGAPHYWINGIGGWGNLGLNGSSLMSWNAWDRRRMGWVNYDHSLLISARDDVDPDEEVDGDLDPAVPSGARDYILRDFVLTGDALRIKLPNMDPARFPQFLWVENHQGRDINNCQFDAWQYEDNECVEGFTPGLFMYLQIDRDQLIGANSSELYDGYAQHTRPLDASGHHDITWTENELPLECIGEPDYAFIRHLPNPLTGFGDNHMAPFDVGADGTLIRNDGRVLRTEYLAQSESFERHIYELGHPRQAFTLSGNTKVGVGTNPSSASHMSRAGRNELEADYVDPSGIKDVRKIHLNGVSIELLAQLTNGSIKVRVRFDDVDVNEDVRWCGDEIVLSPVSTSSGHSLNITTGTTLTLDQGLSATRRTTPSTFNGQQIFADPTLLRCTEGSWLNMEEESEVLVDNGSTLRIEDGARIDVAEGSVLRVKRGGTLEIMDGGVLNVADGGLVLIEEGDEPTGDGRLLFREGARINVEGTTGEVEIAGRLEIGENATFLLSKSADPTLTIGRLRFSNTRTPSTNITAGTGSAFVVRSDNKQRRVLYVDQESLYGPWQLQQFAVLDATAELADGARIVPPISNTCAIDLINARITSPSVPNTHRGLRLNGQPFVTLQSSTFQRGTYGLFCNSTLLGAAPYLQDCLVEECGTGLYALGSGVHAENTLFTQCGTGLLGEQLSQSSYLVACRVTHNQTGIHLQGSTTVQIRDPLIDLNQRGLVLDGMDARVECGSVSQNDVAGFHLRHGAVLRMGGTVAEAHDPVTAVENGTTVLCHFADNAYLNLGGNSLRPETTGTQLTLNGTFLCQPYSYEQMAYGNNWNGTASVALTTAEYAITTCGSNMLFVDPYSSEEVPCGQAVPPCPDPPCIEVPDGFSEPPTWDAFADCPTCREVVTSWADTVALNVACLDALAMGLDTVPDNELEAISRWAEILLSELDTLNAAEAYLIGYGHALLKESYSDAFAKGQLQRDSTDAITNDHLALVDDVLSLRIASSTADSLYHRRLYALVDRAQAYRMAGHFGTAAVLMDSILAWVDSAEVELVARIACLTAIERDLMDSTLHWDALEEAIALCDPEAMMAMHNGPVPAAFLKDLPPPPQPAHAICTPGIWPNPVLDEAWMEGIGDEQTLVRISDLGGRVVWQHTIQGRTEFPADLLRSGLYTYTMSTIHGRFCTGKLVVAR